MTSSLCSRLQFSNMSVINKRCHTLKYLSGERSYQLAAVVTKRRHVHCEKTFQGVQDRKTGCTYKISASTHRKHVTVTMSRAKHIVQLPAATSRRLSNVPEGWLQIRLDGSNNDKCQARCRACVNTKIKVDFQVCKTVNDYHLLTRSTRQEVKKVE